MSDLLVYAGLFLTALVAATVLPMQSEAALVGLLLTGAYPPWLLLIVASSGNTAGSAINWILGRGIERYREKPWFPAKPQALERAQRWYRRYGRWSLLASWVPIIGDPITVVAGLMREPFMSFLVLVAIAKIGRYVALTVATMGWA